MIRKKVSDFFDIEYEDIDIVIFNDAEYARFNNDFTLTESDPRGIAITHPIKLIVLNIDNIDNDDLLHIIIAHEYGHTIVGADEEDADRFALTLLSEENKNNLKRNWNIRHGHEYFD